VQKSSIDDLQWTCNQIVKIISRIIDVRKLTEGTTLTDENRIRRLKRNFN